MRNIVMKNKKLTHDCSGRFLCYFKKPIDDFMHPIFGFDIIKFDNFLETPDGTSTKDFLKRKYGKEASKLIERLLA